MTGRIVADASRLYELDDGLRNTIAQIDLVMAQNDELIRNIREQISEALDQWERRRNDAALSQEEYDQISDVCVQIERISNDFEMQAAAYDKDMESLRQDYVSVLQKSSRILEQYADLVRKSDAVLAGGTGGQGVAFFGARAAETGLPPREGFPLGFAPGSSGSPENLYELAVTNQTWTVDPDGNMVFNTPVETGRKLDACQGKKNGFLGTCGLVSCVNVLRLAGYPASEIEVVDYASTASAGFGRGKLCTVNSFPEDNGGTSAKSRQKVLEHFGVKSELREASAANIAEAVSEGRGVIISVYAGMLYQGWTNHRDLHAVTVTSVKKDRDGNILGFYICDSGTGGADSAKFYTMPQVEQALSGRQMNVTSIIR